MRRNYNSTTPVTDGISGQAGGSEAVAMTWLYPEWTDLSHFHTCLSEKLVRFGKIFNQRFFC